MASVADFVKRFPELCTEDSVRIQLFLDDAALLMGSEARWLDFYHTAQLYFAAHLLAIALVTETGDTTATAPIAHQEVDDVVIKRAFAAADVSSDELYSTSYGKRYLQYRRIAFAGMYGV